MCACVCVWVGVGAEQELNDESDQEIGRSDSLISGGKDVDSTL